MKRCMKYIYHFIIQICLFFCTIRVSVTSSSFNFSDSDRGLLDSIAFKPCIDYDKFGIYAINYQLDSSFILEILASPRIEIVAGLLTQVVINKSFFDKEIIKRTTSLCAVLSSPATCPILVGQQVR